MALVLAMPALAACGFNEQTDQVYQPAAGKNLRSSDVDVLGALVVSANPGKGVFIASLVNKSTTTADKLVGVAGDGIQVSGGTTSTIPAEGLVNLADPATGGIPVRGAQVRAGSYVTVKLTFQNADPVTAQVPVVADTGAYAGLDAPTSAPNSVASKGSAGAFQKASPKASPSASSSASPSPSGSSSGSPSASPSASPKK